MGFITLGITTSFVSFILGCERKRDTILMQFMGVASCTLTRNTSLYPSSICLELANLFSANFPNQNLRHGWPEKNHRLAPIPMRPRNCPLRCPASTETLIPMKVKRGIMISRATACNKGIRAVTLNLEKWLGFPWRGTQKNENQTKTMKSCWTVKWWQVFYAVWRMFGALGGDIDLMHLSAVQRYPLVN